MAMTDLMTKVNRILDGLMGCRLEFQPVADLKAEQWDEADLRLLLGDDEHSVRPPYLSNRTDGTVGFPVSMHGTFAGLAIVRGFAGERTSQLMNLAELFTIAVEHGLAQQERADRLRLIEERMHLQAQIMRDDSNVIPLRPARLGRALQVIEPEETEDTQASPLTDQPLLIETLPGFPIHRIATEIHHLSRRWAFVNFEDMPADLFHSIDGLKEMGAITLFIPNLAKLSGEQQEKLAEYLAIKPAGDMPQVIAGLQVSEDFAVLSDDDSSEAKVLPVLRLRFCVSQLRWTSKTPEQVTKEFVDASLRHILERTRETHSYGDHVIPFHPQYFEPEHPYTH